MPECHKCPKDGTGSPDCQRCRGPSDGPNNHGRNHVSLEQVEKFVAAPLPSPAESECFDAALHAIRALMALGLVEREIVFARMRGEQFNIITARLNMVLTKRITVQGVHAKAKRAIALHPVLAELFRDVLVKQTKRKRSDG